MTDERILLDNLHGRVVALTALCTAMAASRKDADAVITLFKSALKDMHHADSSAQSDHYYLGAKMVHDQLLHVVQQVQLDLALVSEKTPVEH